MGAKGKTLYEVLLGKGRGAEVGKAPPGDRPAVKRKPAATASSGKLLGSTVVRGQRKVGSFGERKFTITCSWNLLLGGAVALVVVLAGMFGLGHAVAGGTAADQGLSRLEEGRIPSEPRPPAPPDTGEVPQEARKVPALCIAFYRGKDQGKEPAGRMARFLQEMGFAGAQVAYTEKNNGWVAAIPLTEDKEAELRARVRRLPPPPFDRSFDFPERSKKMFLITLSVS